MRNSLFHKSLFLVLTLIMAFACVAQKPMFTIYQSQHWESSFGDTFFKALYKGSIDIKDNHLTGLLLVKRSTDSTIRIVFSNEIGMKFFDVEFNGEKGKIHYIFPSMNKKVFVSVLEDDLRMIFVKDLTIDGFKKETKDEIVKYTTQSKRGTLLYTVDKESFRIMNLNTAVKKVKKTIINFSYKDSPVPQGISVDNPFIGLRMQLNLIKAE